MDDEGRQGEPRASGADGAPSTSDHADIANAGDAVVDALQRHDWIAVRGRWSVFITRLEAHLADDFVPPTSSSSHAASSRALYQEHQHLRRIVVMLGKRLLGDGAIGRALAIDVQSFVDIFRAHARHEQRVFDSLRGAD